MKLITGDLDGTLLLRGEKKLHSVTVSAIKRILDKNIVFCVASGRNYGELKSLLKDFDDRIYFIANDGALIVHKEKTLFEAPINRESIKLFDTEKNVVAHGKYVSFVKSDSERFIRQIKEQYGGHVLKADILYGIKEPIYKITLYAKTDRDFGINKVYYDSLMSEYAENGINKGTALSLLLKMLNINTADSIAVGDNVNDIEMLKTAGASYVIATAPPKVKKNGTYIINEFKDVVKSIVEE